MNLHEYKDDFRQLCTLAAAYKHIPESAVRRDYHIVMMLKNLAESEYAQSCVFKGGTSFATHAANQGNGFVLFRATEYFA